MEIENREKQTLNQWKCLLNLLEIVFPIFLGPDHRKGANSTPAHNRGYRAVWAANHAL
jgi:hypothetical protein